MTIQALYDLAVSLNLMDFELYARDIDGDFSWQYTLDYDKNKKEKKVYLD